MNKSIFEIRRWLSLCFLIAAAFVCASAPGAGAESLSDAAGAEGAKANRR